MTDHSLIISLMGIKETRKEEEGELGGEKNSSEPVQNITKPVWNALQI